MSTPFSPYDIVSIVASGIVLLLNLVETVIAAFYALKERSYLTQHTSTTTAKSFLVYFIKLFTDFLSINSIVGIILQRDPKHGYYSYLLTLFLIPTFIRAFQTLCNCYRRTPSSLSSRSKWTAVPPLSDRRESETFYDDEMMT